MGLNSKGRKKRKKEKKTQTTKEREKKKKKEKKGKNDFVFDGSREKEPLILKRCFIQMAVAGIACWLERRTRGRNVSTSNPGRSGGEFSSPESTLCADSYSVSVPPLRVTAVARERPRSFCQKCMWQVTPKHAYTLDPTESEWAVYAAVQA